jgi:two-component system, cell cycle sensor histidine kinase and response regulator CckA
MAEPLQLFLVEDNDDVAYVLRRCLERAGHQITVCRTGADALIVLSHSQFHLVVLDYYLEDMSGLDLLHALRREGIATPVLMITGHGDEQLATQVLRAGALDYVVKDASRAYLNDLPKRIGESVTRHRLQQTNQLLIAALESARDGIFITDLQGAILHVNGALERMFGFRREELLGQHARLFKGEPQSGEFFEEMWRSLLDRSSWQGELVSRRKDETPLDTSLTISPIFDARGRMTHFVGIYRDIGERKQMERQLFQAQKMQSVGTLAGGVAHEFNNLLAGIQGYAALSLREAGLPTPVREFLDFIVTLSDRAANLTRQLLAFARKPALSRQPISLEALLRNTRDLLQQSLSIEVALEVQPVADEMWTALADANQLQQVLVNLSLNARDAMPRPQPAPVVFRLRRQPLTRELPAFPQNVPPGDYFVIDVEDRGAGMAAEIMQQALDPFFTTKDVGQGTGLGLPVAFGIMTGHNGFVTLESQPGVGTCIHLYLPRPSHIALAARPVRAMILEPETTLGRHILVIDDEESVLDVVRRFLQIAGHRVTAASSCREALQLLEQQRDVDLVILDLMIPREEGKTNFQQLRAHHPELPVLLCTGLVHEDQAADLLKEGAGGLLRKPFRMNELWHAVSAQLGGDAGSGS